MAAAAGETRDLKSLLSGEGRDFLVRNNGEQVSISNLHGKMFGIYFSASWCGPCRAFTPELVEFYNEASSKGYHFEVIFVSRDKDEDSFNGYFSEMPWLAIPFSDSDARGQLRDLFEVRGIPHLEVLDATGQVINEDCVDIVKKLGIDAYPFTPEKADELKLAEEKARKEQTLGSLLVSTTRDYLISKDGTKVPVSVLEGKIVALYFFYSEYSSCAEFTPTLVQVYEKLKEKGENFEVVLVPLDEEEASFVESFAAMPWLALPFKDKSCERLAGHFELNKIPYLATIGADGKTMDVDFADIIEEHGFLEAVEAFPFHQHKLNLLAENAKKKMEAQTLGSLLVSGDLDYVIAKEGAKVQVKELVGKNILFYFSEKECDFLPKLLEEYPKIKNKDNAFEIIFVSSDEDQESFEAFYSSMPWLALPFGDDRKSRLTRTLRISDTPTVVAIGPNGRTVTKDAEHLLRVHGADAYPFTEDVIQKLECKIDEMAKGWPEKMKHELHRKHELVLTRCKTYYCYKCKELGNSWSYGCAKCYIDLHPNCALNLDEDKGETETTNVCVCHEDVCHKI